MKPTDYKAKKPAGFPVPMAAAAFHSIAGDIVRLIEPESEADPAALLVRTLSAAGVMIGRGPHVRIGGDFHAARLWPVFVGATGNGRKGLSWGEIRRVLQLADEAFAHKKIVSGLTTGQGLVHVVRDPTRGIPAKPTKAQQAEMDESEDGQCVIDGGVSDKRLLVREAELAKVLAAAARETNNLSATLRDAWDGGILRELTRTNPYQATAAHITVQADITPAELRSMLSATEKANGFANRFLFVAVRRSKLLPFGGKLRTADLQPVADRLAEAVAWARAVEESVGWTVAARPWWAQRYAELNATSDAAEDEAEAGTLAMLLARGPSHILRLALTYALLDGADHIDLPHLEAADAVWRYVADSTAWAFGEAAAEADPLDTLHRWSIGRNPSAAEVARSGPKPWKGDAEAVAEAFARLAEQGRGTWGYDSTRTNGEMRFTPLDNQPDGYGYAFPPDAPANAETVSVFDAAGSNGTAAVHREVAL